MEMSGYGMDAVFEGNVLTVTAKNAFARGAMGAAERSIPVAEIAAISYKAPTILVNGNITVQSSVGLTQIHFLRKQAAAALPLFEAVRDASAAPDSAVPKGKFANERLDARMRVLEDRQAQRRATLDAQFEHVREANQERTAAMAAKLRARQEKVSAAQLKTVAGLLDAAELELLPGAASDDSDVTAMQPSGLPVADQVKSFLDAAEDAAQAGDVALEERRITAALAYARTMGGRKDADATAADVRQREGAGRLRIDSVPIGEITAESAFAQYGRKKAIARVVDAGDKHIIVRSDRVIVDGTARPFDEYVSAQVYLDGQEQITQRPTLTRMLLLAPLPGSALIPGLALQKKTTHDMREAEFQISSVGWSFRASIAPTAVNSARQVAEQVNRIAAKLERDASAGAGASESASVEAALSQLERLAYLEERGALTADDAEKIRQTILG